MKFFSELYILKDKSFADYAEALDWFFSEDRYGDNWNSIKASRLTKHLKKRLPLMSSKNGYQYKNVSQFVDGESNKQPIIQHLSHDSEGKDLIRHIRNGIGHGRAKIKYLNSTQYIILTDYSNSNQTAYMNIPLEYLLIIHNVYKSIADKKH